MSYFSYKCVNCRNYFQSQKEPQTRWEKSICMDCLDEQIIPIKCKSCDKTQTSSPIYHYTISKDLCVICNLISMFGK